MTTIDLLLTQFDQAYDKRSWHGTNLRGSIRGLTANDAAWRPHPERHNIHEIVAHAAYWKYAVRRRLTAEKRGSFPLKGSDWFGRDAADDDQWASDVRLLDECHRSLREVIAALSPAGLQRSVGRSLAALSLVSGIIAHDVYHAGQIQLLKRMRGTTTGLQRR
jgi:DinB superfamily